MKAVPGRFTSMILALRVYLDGERESDRMNGKAGWAGGLNVPYTGPGAAAGGRALWTVPGDAADPSASGSGGSDDARPSAAGPESGAKVEVRLSVAPGPREGSFDATVSILIEEGWHIVGDRTAVPGLVPTALTFNADVPIRIADVTYPPADTLRFGFSDVPLEVFQGEFRMNARIETDPGVLAEGARLYATLYYQACNDAVCLAPDEAAMAASLDP